MLRLPDKFDFEPQCGYFKRRLVRGGAWVPVKIWLDSETDPETGELVRDEIMCCDVGLHPADPDEHWTSVCAHPITKEEYTYLIRLMKYAKKHDDREPLANPRQPIDLFTVPPPEFNRRRRS